MTASTKPTAARRNLSFCFVCDFFGSQAKTAEIVHSTRAVVNHVARGRRPIPAKWAPLIEEASGGKFRCEELVPDFPWEIVRRGAQK